MTDEPTTPEEVYGDPEDETADEEDADKAQPWLDLITGSDKAGFTDYQTRSDLIDKLYADSARLANKTRDAEFQIFWANIEVLKPSIYSRPPVPVVVPRFRDRKPLPRTTSEFLERAIAVTFDEERIDQVMKSVRDDLAVLARGVAWLRYETPDDDEDYDGESVCIEWVSRRDFAHDAARAWKEVDWVAKRSWLTRAQMKKRFSPTSQDAYKDAAFELQKDEHGNDDGKKKAGVWEIWCKSANRVVWVTEGVEEVLDSGEPHLDLQDFFPCPQPAYGTLQRGSLIPVPDFVYYQDQISEINALTNRIAALSDALKLKGFYPAGAAEIGDAIEAAVKKTDDNAILVPISNWAVLGGNADKMIVWLPIDMVAKTVTELVALRKQLIDDVYQITGISDIMRGQTEASETLGAQQLKSQYGSIRVRDRTDELVRFAKDITRIAGEIIAENFSVKTLLAMTQMDIPSTAEINKQILPLAAKQKQLMGAAQQAQANPQIQQAAQQNPDQAKQAVQMVQGQLQQIGQQIEKLKATPTIEEVMALLKEQRVRPFVLDIETDSTIAPDEDAQKKRATEFITAVGSFMGEAIPLVESVPQLAPVAAEMLKFITSQFRAGREMEGVIDEFADQIAQSSGQQKANPAQAAADAKTQAENAALQAKTEAEGQRLQMQQADHQQTQQLRQQAAEHEAQLRERVAAANIEATQLAMAQAAEKHKQAMAEGAVNIRAKAIDLHGKVQTQRIAAQGAAIDHAKALAAPADSQAPADGAPAQAQPQAAPDMGEGPLTLPMLQFEHGVETALADLGKQNTMIAQTLAAVVASLDRPKRVDLVRDANGNMVGGIQRPMPQTVQ